MRSKDEQLAQLKLTAERFQMQMSRFLNSREAANKVFDRLPKSLKDVLYAAKWLEVYQSEEQLLADFQGFERLAKIGVVQCNAVTEASKMVAAWKKQIKEARKIIKKSGWFYNEQKATYERKTKGRNKELITECVHSMLDAIPHIKPDETKIDEKDVKDFVWKIFCFFFPDEKISARNSKVTNAWKYYQRTKTKKHKK